MIATLTFFIGEITTLVLYSNNSLQVEGGELFGICFGIYVFYLLLGLLFNPLLSYLSNIEHGSNFENEYNKVREMKGYFQFHVECFHY